MAGLTGNEIKTTHSQSGAYIGPKAARAPPDHRTPENLFNGLSDLFGPFCLDVASSDENAKCERYFTEEDNAFFQDWNGENVWCNPPYHNIKEWIDASIIQYEKGNFSRIVLLLPANRTEQKWFKKAMKKSSFIGFVTGRLNFHGPHNIGSSSPFGSMIFVIGDSPIEGIGFLDRSGIIEEVIQ